MVAATPHWAVDRGDLEVVQPAAYAGGGGSLALHRVRWRSRPLLFKEYRADAPVDGDVLERLVRWRAALGPDDARQLESSAAFPVAVVMSGARVTGVCVPEAPAQFFFTDRRAQQRPRPLDRMAMTYEHAARLAHPHYQPPHKLAVLGHLLSLIHWLHDRDLVVGDLNAENVLVTAAVTDARSFLLDCDSLWIGGSSPFPRHEAPTLVCPFAAGDAFTRETDLFKFAVLALRCLNENNSDPQPHLALLAEVMPADERAALLAMREPGGAASPQRVESLARAWRNRVSPAGILIGVTDQRGRFPWNEPAPQTPSRGTGPVIWSAVAAGAALLALLAAVIFLVSSLGG